RRPEARSSARPAVACRLVQVPLVLRGPPVLEVFLEAALEDSQRWGLAASLRRRPSAGAVVEQLLDRDAAAAPPHRTQLEAEPERTRGRRSAREDEAGEYAAERSERAFGRALEEDEREHGDPDGEPEECAPAHRE